MNFCESLRYFNDVYDALMDDESKELFDARVDYMIDRKESRFIDRISSLYDDWHCSQVEDYLKSNPVDGIVIYGCGNEGRMNRSALDRCGLSVSCFCDSNADISDTLLDGLSVISRDELLKNYKNYLVIISTRLYFDEIYAGLLEAGFPRERLMRPASGSTTGFIVLDRGNQYFDVFKPSKKEWFVDAGAYNGDTTIAFHKWAGQGYYAVEVMEPIANACELIKRRDEIAELRNIRIYNNAAWDRNEKVCFVNDGSGSVANKDGELSVNGIGLDELLPDADVTFIKMDVEGSEMKALEGARNIIISKKPRLAICIYHKPWDIIEIPAYILSLVPDYKFYIRHYSSKMWETVLYAEVAD